MVVITKEHLFLFFSGCTILQCNTMQVYYHIKILATELSLSIWSNFRFFSWHSYRTCHHLSTWITEVPEKGYKTWSSSIRICKMCWAGWMHEVSTNIHSNFDQGEDTHLQILIKSRFACQGQCTRKVVFLLLIQSLSSPIPLPSKIFTIFEQ